ncbi:hypothetical protein LZ642_19310, partial [Hafnia paralvei]|nr:hypothetical protein [Hafnia paralvei]
VHLSVNGIITQYRLNEIDGTLIQGGDIQLTATAEVEIIIDDRIEVDGKRYRVIAPNPVKPANTLLLYKPQLRA